MDLTLNRVLLSRLIEIINVIWDTKYTRDDVKVLMIELKRFDIKMNNGHSYSVSYNLLEEYNFFDPNLN